MLFTSIKEEKVVFSEQHWMNISTQAKDLIKQLLVKDSSIRLDAEQVLDHPWIVNGGCSNTLQTPTNLKRQVSIKDLEEFANKAMAVNRVVEEKDNTNKVIDSPCKIGFVSFDLSPPSLSTCSLLKRRRRSKELLSHFSSVDELESDFYVRSIY